MKKELRILVILIAVLLVGTVGYYFMPKKYAVHLPKRRIFSCRTYRYPK